MAILRDAPTGTSTFASTWERETQVLLPASPISSCRASPSMLSSTALGTTRSRASISCRDWRTTAMSFSAAELSARWTCIPGSIKSATEMQTPDEP